MTFEHDRPLQYYSSGTSENTDAASIKSGVLENKWKPLLKKKKRKGGKTTNMSNPIKTLKYSIIIFWVVLFTWFILSSLVITLKLDFKIASFSKSRILKTYFDRSAEVNMNSDEFEVDPIDEYSEEDLEQKVLPTLKHKVTRTEENQFACAEYDCLEKCAKKLTTKCLASETCYKNKVRDCRRHCRRTRCNERCELEPPIGYVERGMKLEACKDKCKGPGQEKWLGKCEFEFQPCKQKCRSYIAHKYFCHDGRTTKTIFDHSALLGAKQKPINTDSDTHSELDFANDIDI